MKLSHCELETLFDLSPGNIHVLVVESETQFLKYCTELWEQTQGESGRFCLSEEERMLPLERHALLLSDYFSFFTDDKKFSGKLYRSLQEIAESHFLNEYQSLCEQMADFFAKLNAESDCPIEYDAEGGMTALFKAFGVGISRQQSFLENLLLYLRAQARFLKIRCFFFVNLKTVLSDNDLKLFYRETELNELCLFLLENTQKPKLKGETVTLIDRDLCEILV